MPKLRQHDILRNTRMTPDQFRKAKNIDREASLVRAMITEMHESFSDHKPNGQRGLEKVLKPEYEPVVKLLRERIETLNEEMRKL